MLCVLMKDQSHNRYFHITEGQHVLWQALSALTSLRDFHCAALRCPEHVEARSGRFSGAVAQALWTLALGWPQLTSLHFGHCALSSGEVSGNIETFSWHPPAQVRHGAMSAYICAVGSFTMSDGMRSEGADTVGISL